LYWYIRGENIQLNTVKKKAEPEITNSTNLQWSRGWIKVHKSCEASEEEDVIYGMMKQ